MTALETSLLPRDQDTKTSKSLQDGPLRLFPRLLRYAGMQVSTFQDSIQRCVQRCVTRFLHSCMSCPFVSWNQPSGRDCFAVLPFLLGQLHQSPTVQIKQEKERVMYCIHLPALLSSANNTSLITLQLPPCLPPAFNPRVSSSEHIYLGIYHVHHARRGYGHSSSTHPSLPLESFHLLLCAARFLSLNSRCRRQSRLSSRLSNFCLRGLCVSRTR